MLLALDTREIHLIVSGQSSPLLRVYIAHRKSILSLVLHAITSPLYLRKDYQAVVFLATRNYLLS